MAPAPRSPCPAEGPSPRLMLRAVRRGLTDRWILGALLLAFALRLGWVIWATGTSIDPWSDESQYLSWADQMARIESPSINGQTSSFYAPGYSIFLVPVAWLAQRGAFGLEFGAALVNVPLGVLTVGCTAGITWAWFGRSAARLAGFAMAVAPSYVALTSIALSENLYTPMALLVTLAVSLWVRDRTGRVPSTRLLLGLGLWIGVLYLVRNVGVVHLLVLLVALRWSGVPWRAALRSTSIVLVGVLIALVPWTLRNIRDLGYWSPSNTGNASALCTEHHPGADGWGNLDAETSRRCYWGAPHLGNDREVEWAQETYGTSIRYLITHPHLEVVRIPQRLYWTLGQDRWIGTVEYTRVQSFLSEDPVAADSTFEVIQWFADAWRWAILGLGLLGLGLVPRCRQAVPLWATIAVTVGIYAMGPGGGRFAHPILVLLVPFAAAAVVALRAPSRLRPAPGSSAGNGSASSPAPPAGEPPRLGETDIHGGPSRGGRSDP